MDLIPQEIQKYICSFMDSITRLKMRLANTMWLRIINLTHFKFYFARDADVPKIVELLSHHQSPFSISFPKCDIRSYVDFCAQITKLTALTGLELPDFNTIPYGIAVGIAPKLTGLSVLTNLKSLTRHITFNDPRWPFKGDFIRASQMYQNFKQMTNLEVLPFIYLEPRSGVSRELESLKTMAPMIKQNPDVQVLELHLAEKCLTIDQNFADLFADHKNLTKLTIYSRDTKHMDCNLFKTLCNLKYLSFKDLGSDPTADIGLFGQLTNLETLSYTSPAPLVNVDRLNLLTSLTLIDWTKTSSVEWQQVFQSASALTKLKVLDIQMNEHSDDDYLFLASLQSLESLSLKRGPSQRDQIQILEHISSTKLTKLVINMESKMDLSDIERLNSTLLELELIGCKDPLNDADRAALITTTNITKLVLLGATRQADAIVVEQLSNLKDLIFHDDYRPVKMSLKNLTNLERIASKVEVDITDIAPCKNLTTLKCRFDVQNDTDTDILASLPLKTLFMHDPLPYEHWFRTIGKIHSLESMVIVGPMDEDMETWDGLTNLTRLVYFDSILHGTNLSKLTALQRISTNRTVPHHAVKMLPNLYEYSSNIQYFRSLTNEF